MSANHVFLVCKHCGAVSKNGGTHCVFCGAVLKRDMALVQQRPITDVEARRAHKSKVVSQGHGTSARVTTRATQPKKEKSTLAVKAYLALALGIASAVLTVFTESLWTLPCAVAAIVLGIMAISKKEGGGVAAAVGIGFGVYVLLVSGFWSIFSFYYMF